MTQCENRSEAHRISTVRTTRIHPCPLLAVAIVSLPVWGVLSCVIWECGALRRVGRLRFNGETIAFRASNPQQQAMMRDGQPALVSRQKHSLVLVRPASRQLQANGRPVFVVGINNVGKQPTEFRVAQVEAIQHVGGSDFGMQIVTFEMLQQEEKNRQVARAVLAGVAGAANAYSASQAGHGSYTTPSGRTGTFYSPTAAVIAQNNAAVQNEAMFAATIETGQRNMAALEQTVIKDNTLMPGEWYGGQLHIAPPTDQAGGQKSYTIVITVGQDRHVVDVNQGPAGT